MGKMAQALKKAEKEQVKRKERGEVAQDSKDIDVDPHLVAWTDRMSPISEQYRGLAASLRTICADGPPKSILITSSVKGEGKSTTALNLGVTFAEEKNARVVVVDANLRTPSLHRLIGVDNQRGLADYLSGSVMLELTFQRTRMDSLSIIPSGRLPAYPTELLGDQKLDEMIRRLSRDFTHVLIDAPALDTVTDATVMAPLTEGVLLVVKVGSTPRRAAANAVNALRAVGAPLLGTVPTHLDPAHLSYYYTA
jgi:tyrosine-protein kinase